MTRLKRICPIRSDDRFGRRRGRPGRCSAGQCVDDDSASLEPFGGSSYGFIEPESVIDKAYIAAGINPGPTNQGNLASFCEQVAALPLAYEPGTFWRYSVATDVCARLVEVLSGQTFGEYLRAQIFEPLGMKDTGFYVPASEQHRLISLYAPNNPFDPMASGFPSLNQQMAAPIVSSQPLKAEGAGSCQPFGITRNSCRC